MKLFIIFIVLIFNQITFAKESLTLKSADIKQLIESQNARVKGKNYQAKAMIHRQGYLKRSFLPSLKIQGAQERFSLGQNYTRTQPTYGAELSLNLFNGLKDQLQNQVINKKKQRVDSEIKVSLYEEIIKAKEIYWTLVYLNQTFVALSEVKKINQTNLSSVERRIKSGSATTADRFEFLMKQTEIDSNLKKVNMQKEILDKELGSILGFSNIEKIILADKFEHFEKMEDIGNHNEAQHQFLALPALLQSEENEILARIQSRSWWPRIDAFVAFNEYNVRNGNVFGPQEGQETVMGLRLSMNLFDFMSGNTEASALRADAEGSRFESQYLSKLIENEAHTEITSLNFLHQQIHDAEENIKRSEGYLKITLAEYSRGVKNSPDVLGAIDKLFETKNKYNEILRDFYITRDHLKTKSEI